MADQPLILSVVGTRPEAIKMLPVIRALADKPVRQEVVITGQHPTLEVDLPPSVSVHRMSVNMIEQSPGEITENIRDALSRHLRRSRPDLLLVQGDTTSALAGAEAASDCGVPIGHVEAGLRSFDLLEPWPEEGNRIEIDAMSTLLFAPSDLAATNLKSDPRATGAIYVTGNSGIDALLQTNTPSDEVPADEERKTLLVTCHRRENRSALPHVAEALTRIARDLPVKVVYLLHPNPRARDQAQSLLQDSANVELLDAVGYEQMHGLMQRAWAILTDSGGLQEEGPALGKPVLVLRNRTERAEALASHNAELVGTDPERIVTAVTTLLEDGGKYADMATPRFPFGDGHAAPRIADAVEAWLVARPAPRAPPLAANPLKPAKPLFVVPSQATPRE